MASNHRVFRMNPERLAFAAQYGNTCSNRTCNQSPTWVTAYTYVTGRAGRSREAQREVCTAHAEMFAAKHNLRMPED